MNNRKKVVMGTMALLLSAVSYSEKNKKVDLNTLPPIPGMAPAVDAEKKVMIEELLSSIPAEYAQFAGEKLLYKDVEPQLRAVMRNPNVAKKPKIELIRLIENICKSTLEKKAILQLAQGHKSYKPLTPEEAEAEYQTVVQRYGGVKSLEQMLKRDGLTLEFFKSMIKDNAVIRNYIDAFSKEIKITDEELEVEYNNNRARFSSPKKVRASHILKKLPKDATPEIKTAIKAELEAILASIKQGKDFAALAKKESDCPSASKGGDLNFFEKGRMVKPFSDAAFKMNKGEISEIVETQFGFHIIKVTDIKEGGQKNLDEVKGDLIKSMQMRKMQPMIQKTIQDGIKKNDGKLLFTLAGKLQPPPAPPVPVLKSKTVDETKETDNK